MIGRISGKLLEVVEATALVDTSGVGYEVELSSSALAELPPPGGNVVLHTHFVVREDAQLLYGFANRAERDLFRTYIRINGVGPRLALSLISSVDLAELARSVEAKDTSLLTRVPGVGKKTAERLLVELDGKLPTEAGLRVVTPAAPDAGGAAEEARGALIALGYKPAEAAHVVEGVLSELEDAGNTAEVVRAALKRIARQAELSS